MLQNTKQLTTTLSDDNGVEIYVKYEATQFAEHFEKDEDDITTPLDCTYVIDSIDDVVVLIGDVEVSICNTLLKNSAMHDKVKDLLLEDIESNFNA